MTDEEVSALLRSDNQLVVVEAPAGCGKTFQAAEFAAHAAPTIGSKKILTLTHTHAACSVIAERTKQLEKHIDIRTLDSFIHEIASAYRVVLGLPEDVAAWVRSDLGSHEQLAELVGDFVVGNPMVANLLSKRFPILICDEHQDSSHSQERLVLAIGRVGSRLRIFGDPMQVIPGGTGQTAVVAEVQQRWEALKKIGTFAQLETPHRWKDTNPELGTWILEARECLKNGTSIDFSTAKAGQPEVIAADNAAMNLQGYRFSPHENNWLPINLLVNQEATGLFLAGRTQSVYGLRSTFKNRLPIWEGHTRTDLEGLIAVLNSDAKSIEEKVKNFIAFIKLVVTGFSGDFSSRFEIEVKEPTAKPRGIIPPQMAAMALIVRNQPNHVGFAKAAGHLRMLIEQGAKRFSDIRIDRPKELADLINLGRFEDADSGLAEIKQRRSRAHPKPPKKCLSTIHKAKGLEANTAVVFGCDDVHFPDSPAKRNLLYVALSRPTNRLVIVLPQANPSPLIKT